MLKFKSFLAIVTVGFLIFNLTAAGSLAGEIPRQISFQGKMVQDDVPVAGLKNITFTIGTWSETQAVTVTDGLYSASLGAVNPLPDKVFEAENVRLKVEVDGTTLSETVILSVPYALRAVNADKLNGEDADVYKNIESVNGLKGDQNGNITLVAGENVAITQGNNQIKISAESNGQNPASLSTHSVIELKDVTSAGSGQIITSAERTKISNALTSISGKSVTDLNDVTSAGSGKIITADERNKINNPTVSLESKSVTELNDVTSAGSGQIITDDERDKINNPTVSLATKSVTELSDVKSAGSGEIITTNERNKIGAIPDTSDFVTKSQNETITGIKNFNAWQTKFGTSSIEINDDNDMILRSGSYKIRTQDDLYLQYGNDSNWRDLHAGDVCVNDVLKFNDSNGDPVANISADPYRVRISTDKLYTNGDLDVDDEILVSGRTVIDEDRNWVGEPISKLAYNVYLDSAGAKFHLNSDNLHIEKDGVDLKLYANTSTLDASFWILSEKIKFQAEALSIGTHDYPTKFYVNGESFFWDYVHFYGGYGSSSDLRLKKNITPITNAFDKVTQLQGVNFNWKTEEYPDKHFSEDRQIGLIAQDVEKVLPELVHTDKEGYKSVSYDKITAVLIEAVKEMKAEHQAQIERLEAEIAQLKAQL